MAHCEQLAGCLLWPCCSPHFLGKGGEMRPLATWKQPGGPFGAFVPTQGPQVWQVGWPLTLAGNQPATLAWVSRGWHEPYFKMCLFKLSRQETAVCDREKEAQDRPVCVVEARGGSILGVPRPLGKGCSRRKGVGAGQGTQGNGIEWETTSQ